MASCISGMTTHIRVEGEVQSGGNSQEEQESPAKITGVTENAAVVRIGDTRKVLFCDEAKLTELETLVPVQATVTFAGQNLILFAVDDE